MHSPGGANVHPHQMRGFLGPHEFGPSTAPRMAFNRFIRFFSGLTGMTHKKDTEADTRITERATAVATGRIAWQKW